MRIPEGENTTMAGQYPVPAAGRCGDDPRHGPGRSIALDRAVVFGVPIGKYRSAGGYGPVALTAGGQGNAHEVGPARPGEPKSGASPKATIEPAFQTLALAAGRSRGAWQAAAAVRRRPRPRYVAIAAQPTVAEMSSGALALGYAAAVDVAGVAGDAAVAIGAPHRLRAESAKASTPKRRAQAHRRQPEPTAARASW